MTKLFLCLGDKEEKGKCIHSMVKVRTEERPLFASSFKTQKVEVLSIYCKKKKNYVRMFISQCPDYANMTLEDFNKLKLHKA